MLDNLRPVAQQMQNEAKQDRQGIEHNLLCIKDLESRIEGLRVTNAWLETRARHFDIAHNALVGVKG